MLQEDKQGQGEARGTAHSGQASEGKEDQGQGDVKVKGIMDKCPFPSANVLFTFICGRDKRAKLPIRGGGKGPAVKTSGGHDTVDTVSTHARHAAMRTRAAQLSPGVTGRRGHARRLNGKQRKGDVGS